MKAKTISKKLADYGLEDRELVEVRVTSPTPYNRFSGFGIEMPELGNEDFTVYAILNDTSNRKDLRDLALTTVELRTHRESLERYRDNEPLKASVPVPKPIEPQPAMDTNEENDYSISEDVPEEIVWLDEPDDDKVSEPEATLPFDSNATAVTHKKITSLAEALKQTEPV